MVVESNDVVVVVGRALTLIPALQTSFLLEITHVYFIFEYTTTCAFVEHEELVTGWVALVAVAMGKKIDATMNESSARMLRFFKVAPFTS